MNPVVLKYLNRKRHDTCVLANSRKFHEMQLKCAAVEVQVKISFTHVRIFPTSKPMRKICTQSVWCKQSILCD